MRGLAVVVLLAAGCAQKDLGEHCESHGECQRGVCRDGRCSPPVAQERSLTAQSGVVAPAEQPAVGGPPVRVRRTSGQGWIFAACAATERLLGGGCDGLDICDTCSDVGSWPSHFSNVDTIGARWNCRGSGQFEAYALCQAAPPVGTP